MSGTLYAEAFSGGLNGFIEVKEGVMNDRILDLMASRAHPRKS